MGGHTSKTYATATASAVSETIQQATLNDFTYAAAGNTFSLSGSGNVIVGVDQTVTMTVDETAAANDVSSAATQVAIATAIENSATDKGISFTQWLDDSGDTTKTLVTDTSTALTSQVNSTNCFHQLDGSNLFVVSGSGNVVKNAVQAATVDSIESCVMTSDTVSTSVNSITDAINQSSVYTSENPFAFLSDAIEAVARDAMILGAIVFVLVVAFVATAKVLAHRGEGAAGGATGGGAAQAAQAAQAAST